MKVYAEYFEEPNGNYRKKTLLCFGDSTNLLGSAVLMNPGSAKIIGELDDIDNKFIKSFYCENHKINNMNLKNWKIFRQDPTMNRLEKIFNGWYIGKEKELNGVIQLFNCFYHKNQNFEEAIKNLVDTESNYIFNESQFFLEKPVYFGWGNAGKFGELKPIAEKIFLNFYKNKTSFYDREFIKNSYYHPNYINRSYKRDYVQEILNRFLDTF